MQSLSEKKGAINELLETPEGTAALKIVLLSDFRYFIEVFHLFDTNKEFVFKPFHLEIINALEEIVFGENEKKNLIINMPPRYGKTTICGYFVAFSYAFNAESEFIYTSSSDVLALRFSDKAKKIIGSELFKKVFGLSFSKSDDSKRSWEIDKEGGRFYAVSLGGAITGFGAGIMQEGYGGSLMVDDPLKQQDARSALMRRKINEDYDETVSNRVNNPKSTPIIIIMQRLHIEDLVAHIESDPIGREEFNILKFVAYNEEDKTTLWEEKHDATFFENLKNKRPSYFYAQFQQNPIVVGGNVIKREWFKYYLTVHDKVFRKIFMVSDTAMKVKKHNDYSVVTLWGEGDQGLYLIDMIRGKWMSPLLRANIKKFWEKWQCGINNVICSGLHIEDKANGITLLQDFNIETNIPVIPIKREQKDKLERLENILDYIHSGRVHIPEGKREITDPFLSECDAFTRDDTHAHDDMVDTLIDAINLVNRAMEPGLLFSV